MRRKRLWLGGLLLLALVLSLPLLLNLEMFRGRVHRALERQIGRRVEMASLTARLLPRPGVVARGVTVEEEEGFGHEPFLYAEEVRCLLPARVLWQWRLECAEIHFVRPTLNLTRAPAGVWNVAGLLRPGAPGRGLPPSVSVTEGRINFKHGFDKQIYSLSDVRLRVGPQADGRWRLALDALPTRADRRLGEIGEFHLRGEVGRAAEFSSIPFRLEAEVADGALAEWWFLFTGRELPVRARASLSARLEGTPADWSLRGTMAVTNLRRWDLLAAPRSPRWEIELKLRRLTREDVLLVEEAAVRAAQSELQISGRVLNPFGQPRWLLEASSSRLALEEAGYQLSGLKADVTPGLRWEGVAQVALLAEGPLANWKGTLAVPAGATLRVPGIAEPIQLADLRVRWERGRLALDPLKLQFSPANILTVGGEVRLDAPRYSYRVRWQGAEVEMDALWRTASSLGWDLFENARWEGRGKVDLEWRGELLSPEPPRWQGSLDLREGKFLPPEFNHPLEIPTAQLVWSGGLLEARSLVLRLGEDAVTGSIARRRADSPFEVMLSGPRVRLADLNGLVNPGQRGLFERLVRPGSAPEPNWSRGAVVGKLRFEEVAAGPLRLRPFETEVEWKDGALTLQRVRFRAYNGRFDGRLQADFRNSPPRFRLVGNVRQMAVAGLLTDATTLGEAFTGLASVEIALESMGSRPRELLRNLQGRVLGGVNHGAITQVDLLTAMAAAAGAQVDENAAGSGTPMQSLVGEFRVAEEQVEFDAAQMIVDGVALELSGRVGFDKRLDVRLSGQPIRVAGSEPTPLTQRLLTGAYRVTGTLTKPDVQLAEPLPAGGTPP